MRLNPWLNFLRLMALAFGSILTLVGVTLGIAEGWFLLHAETTQAVILSVPDGHPRFLYKTKQSRQYEVTSTRPLPQYHQGQAVQVAYTAGNPTDAHIISGTPRWFYAMVFSIAGVLMTYLGLWLSSLRRS